MPTFGHPEIEAAGRSDHIEADPRPALYLAPLFDAVDACKLTLTNRARRRMALAQRMYQIAFIEGVAKAGMRPTLRLTPNTDFGAWMVQEAVGIEEPDRWFISYMYRGFGWMMDVREQLQQPMIRPVIPVDPSIIRVERSETIPAIVKTVHERLSQPRLF